LSLRSFFCNFYLNRLYNERKKSGYLTYPFEKKDPALLIVLDQNAADDRLLNGLRSLSAPLFGRIDFLQVTPSREDHRPENNIICPGRLSLSAGLSSKDAPPALLSEYDVVVNLLLSDEAPVTLFLCKLKPQLFVRFDRENEKFYNFIIPSQDKDLFTRFEQFFRIFQTLKK